MRRRQKNYGENPFGGFVCHLAEFLSEIDPCDICTNMSARCSLAKIIGQETSGGSLSSKTIANWLLGKHTIRRDHFEAFLRAIKRHRHGNRWQLAEKDIRDYYEYIMGRINYENHKSVPAVLDSLENFETFRSARRHSRKILLASPAKVLSYLQESMDYMRTHSLKNASGNLYDAFMDKLDSWKEFVVVTEKAYPECDFSELLTEIVRWSFDFEGDLIEKYACRNGVLYFSDDGLLRSGDLERPVWAAATVRGHLLFRLFRLVKYVGVRAIRLMVVSPIMAQRPKSIVALARDIAKHLEYGIDTGLVSEDIATDIDEQFYNYALFEPPKKSRRPGILMRADVDHHCWKVAVVHTRNNEFVILRDRYNRMQRDAEIFPAEVFRADHSTDHLEVEVAAQIANHFGVEIPIL